MSQTLLLSGADRISSSVLNIHYSPESTALGHLSHLADKQSPWNSQLSSMMETAQSLTARRPAATNLPQFQLPPPDHLHNKFQTYAPPSQSIVNSVLTPPAGLPNDLSPLASSVNSNGSSSSSNSSGPYQPNPTGFWPTPQPPPSYSYSSAPPLATSYSQNQNYNVGRPVYSPSQYPNRSTTSPTSGEGLPPPPYDMGQLPPFPTGNGGGGQQQSQQMSNSGMQTSQPPQQSPLHAPESYGGRPPPTQSYYSTPSSTPQQASFPAFTQQSPTQHSPTTGPPQNRISPVSSHSMQPPQGYQSHPYSGSYNLPAMAGPIRSNVHQPGTQMALIGGNMQQMQYPQHQMGGQMYSHHPQAAQNERPFKCDQCPQSFNRNHDLKRHKRIHLAVKPFPCTHCEKSFSRKDALKRHILVKGCGKAGGGGGNGQAGTSQSPIDRSEILSDSTDDASLKKDH